MQEEIKKRRLGMREGENERQKRGAEWGKSERERSGGRGIHVCVYVRILYTSIHNKTHTN